MTIAPTQAHNGAGVEYICPMHPEIRQIEPGTCPKCGMALEPRANAARGEGAENRELVDMTRRLWVSAVLTTPLILLTMAHDAETIEVLRQVNTLVVDKTGTLTEGKPTLVAIVSHAGPDEGTVLRLAASLEQGSEHSLAGAICCSN